jgi:hypothetical protein
LIREIAAVLDLSWVRAEVAPYYSSTGRPSIAQVLKRLDHLSAQEIRYVADCLRKNEQSFLAYVHSGPVSNMMARGLVGSPGGTHHQDYYPYYFADFVWQALLARKDEFIEKDNEHKRREAAERAMRR